MSALSQSIHNPGPDLRKTHFEVSKGKKVQETDEHKIRKLKLTGFSDADWAQQKLDDKKSTSKFCFFLNSDSDAISWISKSQRRVGTSRAEAEAMSLCSAFQKFEFLRGLANKIGINTKKPTKIQVDHQDCIAISKITVKSQK